MRKYFQKRVYSAYYVYQDRCTSDGEGKEVLLEIVGDVLGAH